MPPLHAFPTSTARVTSPHPLLKLYSSNREVCFPLNSSSLYSFWLGQDVTAPKFSLVKCGLTLPLISLTKVLIYFELKSDMSLEHEKSFLKSKG